MSGNNNHHYDPDDQDQKQKQAQAELQAQLELQAQAQGQGQGQGQNQGQGQYQFALNENYNENESENKNENENENSNENKLENELDNKVDNELDNKVDNDVDNDVENKVENKIENSVETNVETDVKVDVDLDLDAEDLGLRDNDVIDIDWIKDIDGSVVMPDVVTQTMNDGNQFNIDQVNNLVDKDFLWSAEVKNDGKVEWEIKAEGGEAKIDDVDAEVDGVANTLGNVGTATADALASQEAFTQNIVMGANIQFNSIEINAAGNDLTSGPSDDIS